MTVDTATDADLRCMGGQADLTVFASTVAHNVHSCLHQDVSQMTAFAQVLTTVVANGGSVHVWYTQYEGVNRLTCWG